MKIAIGNDHTALEMKNEMKKFLEEKGYEVIDYGTNSTESCDYPVYGEKVGNAVAGGEADLGLAICGTGVGISLACNKVKGIRAACCSDCFSAKLTRQHNDANILCMGGRVVGAGLALMMTDLFLNTEFEGGRHQTRIDKIAEIERKQ